ncbi:hypothetical protein V2J09_002915, partial [Rumex salicifolius]
RFRASLVSPFVFLFKRPTRLLLPRRLAAGLASPRPSHSLRSTVVYFSQLRLAPFEMEDDRELSDSELELDSDEEEDIKLAEPSKTAIYNREGLMDKLADIKWPDNVDWVHKLSIDLDVDGDKEVDVNDDLARELAFYTQALEGTRQAFGKLHSMGVPFLRPEDYYAEMVKSDNHMVKVKSKLLYEKKQIEEAEERRKSRESKRIAKEVQAEKQKEKVKDKKQQIEAVKKWRKQRQQSGFSQTDKDEMNLPFEDGNVFERPGRKKLGAAPGDRSGGKGRKPIGDKKRMNSREKRDSKFGYGGKKGMKKQNTSDTTSDLRGFNSDSHSKQKKRKMNWLQCIYLVRNQHGCITRQLTSTPVKQHRQPWIGSIKPDKPKPDIRLNPQTSSPLIDVKLKCLLDEGEEIPVEA